MKGDGADRPEAAGESIGKKLLLFALRVVPGLVGETGTNNDGEP